MRVITSEQSSVGKSLHIKRQIKKAKIIDSIIKSCLIKKQTLPFELVFKELKRFDKKTTIYLNKIETVPKILQIDIA